MVGDPRRTPILLKAIRRVVKRGDVVLDLGCGTGILSFAAIRAGASRVYACDIDPVIHRAARQAKKRGLSEKIVFFQALSSEISLPEKVDVILSETVGSLGLNENILPFVADARKRLLKRRGKIIPERLAVFVAPIDLALGASKRRVITDLPFLVRRISPNDLLADAKQFCLVDLRKTRSAGFDRILRFRAVRDGLLRGFAGWIGVTWAGGLVTRTSPLDPPTHWKQAILSNRNAEKILRGDRVTFRLRIAPRGSLFSSESAIEWGYKIRKCRANHDCN